MSIYSTGTVDVTNGDATVTGIGTGWAIGLVAGGMFSCMGLAVPIASVTSDTELELAYDWPGTTETGEAYAIALETALAADTVELTTKLASVLARLIQSGALTIDPGILYTFDTGTADSDQGPGKIWFDNANLGDATVMYLSKTSAKGSDVSVFLASLDDSTSTVKGRAIVSQTLSGLQSAFKLGAVTDDTDYVKVAISDPSGEIAFAEDAPISFQFAPSGDAGGAPDGSITNAKLANVSSQTIKGRTTAGSGSPEDLSASQVATILAAAGLVRELLGANRTYYVRSDGSDSNNGLADNAGGAFLTTQKAIDVVMNDVDLNGYDVTIQVRDATRSTSQSVSAPWVGKGTVTVQGNSGTPANVLFNGSGSTFTVANGGTLTVKDMELRSSSNHCLVANNGGQIKFQNIRFGATANGQHLRCANFGLIEATGNYSITGSAQRHVVSDGGAGIDVAGRTVTLSGTPAFSQMFASVEQNSWIKIYFMTFSGSATGKRYEANNLGIIHTGSGSGTYLPGNSAGSTANGGVYT